MRAIRILVILLLVSPPMSAQQQQEEGVGRMGDQYTWFRATLPMPESVPEKLDRMMGKLLFDTAGVTVREAYQAYLSQYDEVLPVTKTNTDLAGLGRHLFSIRWYDYVKDRFASFLVVVQRQGADGHKTRNRRKPVLYDLRRMRSLKLEDVFTESMLNMILNNGGERHQLSYINNVGVVTVEYRKDKKRKEERFSTSSEPALFQPSFLELVGKTGGEQQREALSEKIYEDVDQEASFPDGKRGVTQYFREHVRFPRQAFENKRYLQIDLKFIVDIDGRVHDAEMVHPIHPLLDEELVRVAKQMPRWQPAMKNGLLVRSVFTYHLTYHNPSWKEK